jgi:zinc protease
VRRLPALLLSVAALPAAAQEVTTATLDNGMEVVVIEDHRAPVAVHMVWYRTGSADEPPGVSGVAHFLEHLLFKATDDMESGSSAASWPRTAAPTTPSRATTTPPTTSASRRPARAS